MPIASIRAADFLSSEGVDTHIPYTDGAYSNVGNIIADLNYLGISKVRDGIVTPGQFGSATLASYEQVAEAGIKFTMVVAAGGTIATTGGTLTNPSLDQRIATIDQLVEAVPGSVIAIEGVNEINNAPIVYDGYGTSGTGSDELNAALAMQRDLYTLVHSDPTLAGVSVDYFTGYNAGTIPVGPDPATTAGLADFDTQHPYPNYGQAPAFWVSRSQALGNETASDAAALAPVVYTEAGYSSNGGTQGAVDQNVQAKYTLDLLLDDAKNGVSATYLYELLDAYAPGSVQGDAGYGLFDFSGNPKPVAVDIHNMNAILQDTGATAATFQPVTLSYVVHGETATGNDFELAKSDGSHIIALWDEQSIWNAATGSEITPASIAESVAIGNGTDLYDVVEYDPTTGTAPVASFAQVTSVNVTVVDHPVFLSVKADTQASSVAGLYQTVLGRAADPAGLAGFTQAIAQGTSLSTVRGYLAFSPEAQGDLNALYQSVLGRAADAGGLASFSGYLAGTGAMADIRGFLATSAEAQADLAGLYQSVLGRAADLGGLTSFTQLLIGGVSLATVRADIAVSPEAQATVQSLLLADTGAAPSAVATAAAQQLLAGGMSLSQLNNAVVSGFFAYGS